MQYLLSWLPCFRRHGVNHGQVGPKRPSWIDGSMVVEPVIGDDSFEVFRKLPDGVLHSVNDLPARIKIDREARTVGAWWFWENTIHRQTGPAIELWDFTTHKAIRIWVQNGKLGRKDLREPVVVVETPEGQRDWRLEEGGLSADSTLEDILKVVEGC